MGGPFPGLSFFSKSKQSKQPPALSTRLICCSVLDNGLTSCKTNETRTISLELSGKGILSILPFTVLVLVIRSSRALDSIISGIPGSKSSAYTIPFFPCKMSRFPGIMLMFFNYKLHYQLQDFALASKVTVAPLLSSDSILRSALIKSARSRMLINPRFPLPLLFLKASLALEPSPLSLTAIRTCF